MRCGVHQKFHRARIRVARFLGEAHGGFAHGAPQFRRHDGRRRFLDYFLVPPLDGTFALAQMHDVAMRIAEDLNFNVARPVDVLFEIKARVAKRVERFRSGIAPRANHLRIRRDHAHAFPASARHRLEQDRISKLASYSCCVAQIFDWILGPGNHGHSSPGGKLAGGGFRSQALHRFGRWPDERDVVCGASPREFRILGEESIPGMQRVASGAARGLHHLVDAQIAFARGSGAYPVRFIGEANMQRGAVRVAKNGGGGNAHLAASSRDPHGDFPAIGDENFAEHFFQTSNSEQDSSTAGKRDVRLRQALEFRGHGKFFGPDNHLLLYDAGRRKCCLWPG